MSVVAARREAIHVGNRKQIERAVPVVSSVRAVSEQCPSNNPQCHLPISSWRTRASVWWVAASFWRRCSDRWYFCSIDDNARSVSACSVRATLYAERAERAKKAEKVGSERDIERHQYSVKCCTHSASHSEVSYLRTPRSPPTVPLDVWPDAPPTPPPAPPAQQEGTKPRGIPKHIRTVLTKC